MSIAVTKTAEIYDRARLDAFLQKNGCRIVAPVGQDSSIRRYYRVERASGQGAIVMESVPDHSPLMTKGHKMSDFIRISAWLNEAGLNAPDIYDADLDGGYLLLEDFGDTSFKAAIAKGADTNALYTLAADVLERMRTLPTPLDLPAYYESHVHANHRFVMEYYFQRPDLVEPYLDAWKDIEKGLTPAPLSFTHIDFHAENLMLIDAGQGLERCGILDFQGAMIGPAAYDLANLLEDARVSVPRALREDILSRYDADFRAQYRVLATQFHCRVIGQFIKIRNESGNAGYMQHIPRLENYIAEALEDPLLEPLKRFFDNSHLNFPAQ